MRPRDLDIAACSDGSAVRSRPIAAGGDFPVLPSRVVLPFRRRPLEDCRIQPVSGNFSPEHKESHTLITWRYTQKLLSVYVPGKHNWRVSRCSLLRCAESNLVEEMFRTKKVVCAVIGCPK